MNFFAILTQVATEKISWTDRVFQKWLDSGDEAYLFLIIVLLGLIAIVSALIFLFKLYVSEKEDKYKQLKSTEAQVEAEKEKLRIENKKELDKWIEKWGNKTEDYSSELITAIKFNNQALEDIYEELEKIKDFIGGVKNAKRSDNSDFETRKLKD